MLVQMVYPCLPWGGKSKDQEQDPSEIAVKGFVHLRISLEFVNYAVTRHDEYT